MGGAKMTDAIAAIQVCLRGIPEGCEMCRRPRACTPTVLTHRPCRAVVWCTRSLFQIVSFGSSYEPMFDDGSREYNDDTLAEATAYVDGMTANMGGTELGPPLQDILSRTFNANRPRQVFLFTGERQCHAPACCSRAGV